MIGWWVGKEGMDVLLRQVVSSRACAIGTGWDTAPLLKLLTAVRAHGNVGRRRAMEQQVLACLLESTEEAEVRRPIEGAAKMATTMQHVVSWRKRRLVGYHPPNEVIDSDSSACSRRRCVAIVRHRGGRREASNAMEGAAMMTLTTT